MCNFCLQSSDIRDAGEFLPLTVYLREGIFLSCSRGSRVSPGKILEKWTQMVHSESIFGRLQGEFYPI